MYRLSNGVGEIGGAVGWESLSGEGLKDQKASEIFFRWDVTPHLSLTPSAQILIDPALNPTEDFVAVVAMRLRVTF